MSAPEIEAILANQYINLVQSYLIKVKMMGGFMAYGKFFKRSQKKENVDLNKWTFTCVEIDMILNGNEIISIERVVPR